MPELRGCQALTGQLQRLLGLKTGQHALHVRCPSAAVGFLRAISERISCIETTGT
jgi:hypothetical protein